MDEKFKTLIIEDDEANIEILKILLSKYCKNIDVIGEAKNSNEFIDKLLGLQPDILLLDIELGEEKNTLDLLNEVREINSEIIIISSHENYALKAINQHHVSGYIVKPIDPKKLKNAIQKVEKKLLEKKINLKNSEKSYFSKNIIGIPTGTSIDLIDTKHIMYLEADGKYTIFHMAKDIVKVASKNIGHYEKIISKHLFLRIHHKYIVNLKKITTISRSDGNYCLLKNGKSLPIANRRKESLRKFLHLK